MPFCFVYYFNFKVYKEISDKYFMSISIPKQIYSLVRQNSVNEFVFKCSGRCTLKSLGVRKSRVTSLLVK